MSVNWNITNQNVIVNFDGQTHIISREDKFSEDLIQAIRDGKMDQIPMLVSKAKAMEHKSNGVFKVVDGQILLDGVMAPVALSKKILQFLDEGLPYEPLVLFAKKLQKNPSYRSVQQLFSFLEKNDHPITDTGNFIAYKKVRDDFKDVHTGTFDNSVGAVLEMPRNQVDEDPNQTCSHGFHVASWEYATEFYQGGVMLELEIDPADVVAVPVDYQNSKMRVSKYRVLSVVQQELSTSLRKTTPTYVENDDIDVDFEDEEYEEDDDLDDLFDDEDDEDTDF